MSLLMMTDSFATLLVKVHGVRVLSTEGVYRAHAKSSLTWASRALYAADMRVSLVAL